MFLTCCPVCQTFFTADDSVMTTECGHLFHAPCIERWLSKAKSCPVCQHTTVKSKLIRLYLDNHSFESPKSIGVDVRNRDGVFLRFIVRPIDTVGSLINELLESREVDRVFDLRLDNVSLLHGTVTTANSLLIRDCGLRPGSVLSVMERPLIQCHVHLLASGAHRRPLSVDLLDGEGVLQLRQHVAKAFGLASPRDLPLLYVSGGVSEKAGRIQRYNRVRMSDTQKEMLMNTNDPLDVSRTVGLTHYCRTLLQDNDILPPIEDAAHVVKARAAVEFWQLVSNPWAPFHHIENGDSTLFDSPVYCAWFSAYIVPTPGGGEDRFFLHCFGDVYSDMMTGEMVEDPAKLPGESPDAARYAVIFVAPQVRFPRFQIDGEKRLFLWCREGVRLGVKEGALEVVTKRPRPRNATWVAGRGVPDQLAEFFKTEPTENIYDEADWCHRDFRLTS